jgi:hypothetical protein
MGGGTGGAGGGTFSKGQTGVGKFLRSGLGSGLIGGLADGIGSLFTIGAQKRAATTSYKRQKEFWNMQNAYNTFKAQMQRLKDAGLNPALMYGQGNVGNAMGLSSVGKADVSGPSFAQSVASGSQMSLLNSQKKLLESQATLNAIKGANDTEQVGIAKYLAKYQADKMTQDIKVGEQQVKNMVQQKLTEIQKESLTKQQYENEKIIKEINAIDKDFLKRNKTSKYDINIIRGLKEITGNISNAIGMFINYFSPGWNYKN